MLAKQYCTMIVIRIGLSRCSNFTKLAFNNLNNYRMNIE